MNNILRKIEINWVNIWGLLALVLSITIIYNAKNAFLSFVFGIILSLGLDPIVSFVSEKLKIRRLLAVIFLFILLIILILLFFYLITPVFINEFTGFIKHLNELFPKIPGISLFPENLQKIIKSAPENIDYIYNLVSQGLTISSTFINFLKNIVFILSTVVITLYLSAEKNGTRKMLEIIIPSSYEKTILKIFDNFQSKMKRWFLTQIALSLIIGLMVFIGLSIIGVKYSFLLGIIAGILEIVPIIGPVITAILAFLVAASESLKLGIFTVVLFMIIQQLENHLLIPILIGKGMKIHPVVVILSILVGGEIAGIVGVIIATPAAILIQEIINYIGERKIKNKEFAG
jgi:predicted PurR-regulated permease PerM